jgi:hypothetical protein
VKPTVSPYVVATVLSKLGVAYEKQAEACGLTRRGFQKLVNKSWDYWRVGVAEKWLRAYGMDLWNLVPPRVQWDGTLERDARVLGKLVPKSQVPLLVQVLNGEVGTGPSPQAG